MTPQCAPSYFLCLPTAFAVVFDEPVRDLMVEIGHDGSEIVFPTEPEPQCRRGFHAQEFIRPAWNRGYVLSEIQFTATIEVDDKVIEINSFREATEFMEHFNGVVIGTKPDGQCHALAWDKERFYDSDGTVHDLHYEMTLLAFIAVIEIKAAQRIT